MKNKGVQIFFSVVLAIVLLCGTVAIVKTTKNGGVNPYEPQQEQKTTADDSAANAETQPQKDVPTAAKVTMLSVGDNLIHDGIYKQAQKRAGQGNYDFSFCYSRIKPIVESVDVATINQETIVAKSYPPSGYPMFNSPLALGEEVCKTGFDVVNLANNHMLDKGAKGLLEAIDFWTSQKGVVMTGAYRDKENLQEIQYIERNGMKIGLVGVTQYLNGLSLPKDSPLQIILTSDEATIESKIKKAKAVCDAVLVNAHWGTEYNTTPTPDQEKLAQKMADWGADVIIGHHPHVLQPVTWLDRKDGGRTLCVYSLGNFISQQNTGARVIGGMLHYTLQRQTDGGGVTVEDVYFEPVVTHYVSGSHDVQIYPFAEYTDALAKKQAARLKEPNFSCAYIEEFVKKVIPAEFLKEA